MRLGVWKSLLKSLFFGSDLWIFFSASSASVSTISGAGAVAVAIAISITIAIFFASPCVQLLKTVSTFVREAGSCAERSGWWWPTIAIETARTCWRTSARESKARPSPSRGVPHRGYPTWATWQEAGIKVSGVQCRMSYA